jgi:isovaleryl-CoA dehydrogenase
MSEPDAGSDVVRRGCASTTGDHCVLNGKLWITNGHYARTLVVYAKLALMRARAGITAFLIESGVRGFWPAQKLDKLGMRGSLTSELVFGIARCRLKTLGQVDEGVHVLMSGLD